MAETIALIALILVIGVILFLTISFAIAIFGGGPFVPTKWPAVHEVLKHAKIKKGEIVYDIGAGDGRFVHIAASKYGAKAKGFELDPFVYFIAKFRQKINGWKGEIVRANTFKQDLSKADVIICYMMPKPLKKFQKQFDKQLKKGTRVISYAFSIGDWKPKKIVPKTDKLSQILIYEKK